MLTTSIRPYSDEEKARLIAQLPSRYARVESFALKFAFSVGFFALLLILMDKRFPLPLGKQLWATLAATALALGSAYWLTMKYEGGFSNRSRRAAIAAGQVAVLHVRTSRAVEQQDPEDFGAAYYLEVQVAGQPKILYLQGQYLDELEEGRFPNTEFEIVRSLDDRATIGLLLLGQPFRPERVLPAFSMTSWRSDAMPIDGAILEGQLAELS